MFTVYPNCHAYPLTKYPLNHIEIPCQSYPGNLLRWRSFAGLLNKPMTFNSVIGFNFATLKLTETVYRKFFMLSQQILN